MRVFYSWQSDLPSRTTRSLVETALKNALKEVESLLSVNLILDQDSRGASGSPNIPETIQAKIRSSTVFVADLSIVAQRERGGGLPNGCVSVEWGWAEEALGSSALIGTMNTAHGGAEMLPVDIRQNLVRVKYAAGTECSIEALQGQRLQVTKALAAEIEVSIRGRFFKGFHAGAPQVVRALMELNPETMTVHEHLRPADVAQAAGVTEEVAKAVMDDMLRTGLAQPSGGGGSGFMIRRTPEFYMHFDPLFMGWNADCDAVVLARGLVKHGPAHVVVLNSDLGWSPRRMDPAILRLVSSGFAGDSKETSSQFARVSLRPNAGTRALAEGRIDLEGVPTTVRTARD